MGDAIQAVKAGILEIADVSWSTRRPATAPTPPYSDIQA